MSDTATGLEKLNNAKVQTVLNLLLESPFFYRDDDPEHFQFLRANRAAFSEFIERFFGWRLFVDRNLGRILKDRVHNTALQPGQRMQFQVGSRQESIVFLLLLEFYEHEMLQQNVASDSEENLRFQLASFLEFARRRLGEVLGDNAPDEKALLDWSRPLLRKLKQFRFLKEVERSSGTANETIPEILFEVLPGLHCYEATQLAQPIIAAAFNRSNQEPDSGPNKGDVNPGGEHLPEDEDDPDQEDA